MIVPSSEKLEPLLPLSHGHPGRPTVTTLCQDFLIQMQCGPDLLVFKDPSEPRDLIRRLKKRVITEKGRVLSLHDFLDFPHCFGSHVPDALEMLWNEQEVVGIDMPRLDESASLFWATTG